MTLHLAVTAVVLGALLTGCAGPSISSAEQREGPTTFVKPFEAGTVANGTYSPSDTEKALDCRKLKGSMLIIIARLKDSDARPRPSVASSAIQFGVASVRGKPNSMDLSAELQRERARLTAYNGLLAEKKCQPMDLAKELAAPR